MNCLFCQIAARAIPSSVLYEDDEILAFRDIKPQAPTHLLIIPKKHIATIDDVETEDGALLGNMVLCAKGLAARENINESGYRLVFNVKANGGQEVYHIHLHLLAGRRMTWPPG